MLSDILLTYVQNRLVSASIAYAEETGIDTAIIMIIAISILLIVIIMVPLGVVNLITYCTLFCTFGQRLVAGFRGEYKYLGHSIMLTLISI